MYIDVDVWGSHNMLKCILMLMSEGQLSVEVYTGADV